MISATGGTSQSVDEGFSYPLGEETECIAFPLSCFAGEMLLQDLGFHPGACDAASTCSGLYST